MLKEDRKKAVWKINEEQTASRLWCYIKGGARDATSLRTSEAKRLADRHVQYVYFRQNQSKVEVGDSTPFSFRRKSHTLTPHTNNTTK
jgi:hypothetical protein